eukprot:TRINITY_DN3378_c0_g1_i1.p1 TRINITY_DN3378_c0_g1~~TRINITY_DN3378_c0_g1_i1.p1  ORF type:complete len:825 (-),score=169.46 TRINITY_DN3378_c0_g1_i1:507-2981(-)
MSSAEGESATDLRWDGVLPVTNVEKIGFSKICRLTVQLLEKLENREVEVSNVHANLTSDDLSYYIDKYARKLMLFSCLKWFMDRELDSDLALFWIEVEEYKCPMDQEERTAKAWDIFDRYVKQDSQHEIIVTTALREKLLNRLGNPSPDIFDQLQDDVTRDIRADYYVRLMKHPVFHSYANAVHAVLPAIAKNQKELEIFLMIRKGHHVLKLMETLEVCDAKDTEEVEIDDLFADPLTFNTNLAMRRLLMFTIFKAFIDKEMNTENLNFWLAVDDYKYTLTENPNLSQMEIKSLCQRICTQYIKAGAQNEVNIQFNLRAAIESEVSKSPSINVFDVAQHEVLLLLRRNSYERFLKSSEYQEFMNKLNGLPTFYSLDLDRKKRDEKFREKYKLPDSECLAVEINCSLEGKKMILHGSLQISPSFVCFGATVFGFKTREAIPFKSIQEIEPEAQLDGSDMAIKIITDERSFLFKNFTNWRRAHSLIRKCWLAAELRSVLLTNADEHAGHSEDQENEKESSVLTEKDWSLFQEGAKVVAFTKDTPILKAGEKSNSLYQIARGKVRIEIDSQVLRTLDEGQLFGEISFLEGGTASANVIADDNPTAVYIIDGSFIEGLLKVEPGLPGRFYNYLAIQMADRLRSRKMPAASTPDEGRKKQITDEKYQKTFGLPKDENLKQHWTCCLERKMKYHGTIFISTNYLCFSAQVLGMKTKETIHLKEISTITANDAKIEVTTSEDKEFTFAQFENVQETHEVIAGIWRQCKATSRAIQTRAQRTNTEIASRETKVGSSKEVLSQKVRYRQFYASVVDSLRQTRCDSLGSRSHGF